MWIKKSKRKPLYHLNYMLHMWKSSMTMQKHVKKEKMVEKKKEKITKDLVLQNNPKPFVVVKCKLVDETIRGEYGDLFPWK